MIDTRKNTFQAVAFTHFVPCFFLGVLSLYLVRAILPAVEFSKLLNNSMDFIDLILGIINGLIVSAMVVIFHLNRNHRIHSGKTWFRKAATPKTIMFAGIVGFLGGGFDILLGFHNEGIILLTLMVLAILVWHLRIFAHDMVDMLAPGNHATWTEVAELLRIYMNMLAGFTLINATLEVAHIFVGSVPPFGFGSAEGELFLNSLYYTVVTMTTLGYGDIVPKTWDGKLLLIFQCLASYVMFALMIGIITRGVTRAKTPPEKSTRDT